MTLHVLPTMRPTFTLSLSEEDARIQARLLQALSDPTRLGIISLLSRHGGNISVFEIVECFLLEQPTISHHLRILRDAGIIDFHKRGLSCFYYLKPDMLHKAVKAIQEAGGLL
jgi:ArsR family transcriptional regulator, arsenate/arsenite/antimonite-responsive transcriptional repressor